MKKIKVGSDNAPKVKGSLIGKVALWLLVKYHTWDRNRAYKKQRAKLFKAYSEILAGTSRLSAMKRDKIIKHYNNYKKYHG